MPMEIGREEAHAELLRLFLMFEGHPPSDQDEEGRCVENYVEKLADKGWTRSGIYGVIANIDSDCASSMPKECSDAVGNYISGLIGWVSVGCIVRLPGEPVDIEEHARYVRSQEWLR